MSGNTVRNTVLIAFVSVLVLTLAVQPAVCLQTSFITEENINIQFVPLPVVTLEEANPDLADNNTGQEMEFKYDEDKTLGDDYEKVTIRQKDSTSDNISTPGSTFDISLTVPKDKDFTFGVTLSWHIFTSNDVTISVTGPFNGSDKDPITKEVTVKPSASLSSTTYYIKNENKKLSTTADISDLDSGKGYWFKGSSGEYEVKISGDVADSQSAFLNVKLEFSVIFKE